MAWTDIETGQTNGQALTLQVKSYGRHDYPSQPFGHDAGIINWADIWEYCPAVGFQQAGSSDAAALAMDGYGDVMGAFDGAGVWEFDPSRGWYQLAASEASHLAMA